MIVRFGTEADVPKIAPHLAAMHEEKQVFPPINPADTLGAFFDVAKNGLLIVIDHDGEIGGFLALKETSHWFNTGTKFIADLCFFVPKSYRKTSAAAMMINVAQAVSDRMNLPLMLADVGADDVERKRLFYARKKMVPFGSLYAYGFPELTGD